MHHAKPPGWCVREDSTTRLGSELGKVVEAGELRNVVSDLQQPRHVADRVVQPLQAVAAARAALYRRVASQEGALQRRMPYKLLPTFSRKSWSCVIRQAAPARHLATPDAACKHTAATLVPTAAAGAQHVSSIAPALHASDSSRQPCKTLEAPGRAWNEPLTKRSTTSPYSATSATVCDVRLAASCSSCGARAPRAPLAAAISYAARASSTRTPAQHGQPHHTVGAPAEMKARAACDPDCPAHG